MSRYHMRQESFGGTLFDVTTGRRTYVDPGEFDEIARTESINLFVSERVGVPIGDVQVVRPSRLFEHNFGAPDKVFMELTRGCNLRCTHCLNGSGSSLAEELSTDQIMRIIEDSIRSGVQELRFTGGEPTLAVDLPRYISLASSGGLRTSIGTNAVQIKAALARRLRDAGLNSAIVSIDGLPDRHDAIRGSGMFDRAMRGMRNLLAEGIDVRVNAVVMQSTLDEVVPLVELLAREGIRIMLRRLIPSGRARDMRDQLLTAKQYAGLEASLSTWLDDPRGLLEGHYLREVVTVPRVRIPFRRKECSAGHRGLVVLPTGQVQTCGFLADLGERAVGRLPDSEILDVWYALVQSSHIKDLERNLDSYNATSGAPRTDCLALAFQSTREES